MTPVRNMRLAVKPSPIIFHSSPVEEKKLGFPFSEDGPSAIRGEGATSAFSDLREWEERVVTTPSVKWPLSVLSFSHLLITLNVHDSSVGSLRVSCHVSRSNTS